MSEETPPEFSEEPKRPQPPEPLADKPSPPPAGMLKKEESPLMEYMRHRLESMERELVKERERANASEQLLSQQAAMRNEVESHLEKIGEQLHQDKKLRDLETEKEVSHDRIEALEKRLDEMHDTWASLVRDAMARQEAGQQSLIPEVRSVVQDLASTRDEIGRLKDSFGEFKRNVRSLPDLTASIDALREGLPAIERRREQSDQDLRDQLHHLAESIAESLGERLTAIDRRLSKDLQEHQDRLRAFTRDRQALSESVEERHQRIRQEHLKERAALEAQFNEKVERLGHSIDNLGQRQAEATGGVDALKETVEKLAAHLSRPEKAKDQLLQDLEKEKNELHKALRQRNEQINTYAAERREVERSLGESLLEASRQSELERAKQRRLTERVAELEAMVDGIKSQDELKHKELERFEGRERELAAERDKLVEALTAEAEKVRTQIDEKLKAEKNWEARFLDLQKSTDDERNRRMHAEAQIAELKHQIQTLSEHMSSMLRDKDADTQQIKNWQDEKKKLQSTLRKKDDMINMLSTTFQNLLKPPS